jgi:hypothetical protein
MSNQGVDPQLFRLAFQVMDALEDEGADGRGPSICELYEWVLEMYEAGRTFPLDDARRLATLWRGGRWEQCR